MELAEYSDVILALLGGGGITQLFNIAVSRMNKLNMWKMSMDRIEDLHKDILNYEEDTRKLRIELNLEKDKNLELIEDLKKCKDS